MKVKIDPLQLFMSSPTKTDIRKYCQVIMDEEYVERLNNELEYTPEDINRVLSYAQISVYPSRLPDYIEVDIPTIDFFKPDNPIEKLEVKRLSNTAKLPTKAYSNDAGFDIYANEMMTVYEGQSQKVKTGLAISIPKGYFGRLVSRSGLSSQTSLRIIEGTIDSGYTGEVSVLCDCINDYYKIKKGDKIAQLIIQSVPNVVLHEVDLLESSDRGSNGFGSTGR
ncbi:MULTISPECIES: dUTP diphosphatase [Aerococcus]|uniref:dUTP diphosphatase n=1 Tax=Aerococcus TaxID=1375 RepID=UPI001E4B4CE7|nr:MULTISPECIES: dUTP diphosphatase [Aerococcus]MCY3067628.1 dUTP diphosphatase [Aerococcus mictus]MCY3080470.1 dUTP diphosphatase [Aerococcus mictus]MDK8484533.1 dUTP diphosphatase [Aerococcus urinae]